MKKHPLFSLVSISLFLVLSLTACITDPISWSPDGRYLAFIGPDDQKLWLFDGQTSECKILSDEKIIGCRFLPNGREIVYGIESNDNSDDHADFEKIDILSGQRDRLVDNASFYFDISGDGRFYFYLKEDPDRQAVCLWQKDLSNNEETLLFGQNNTDIQCLDANANGQHFLIADDQNTLGLFDKETNQYRCLRKEETKTLLFPQWLDENRYVYFEEESNSDEGILILDSIDKSNPKTLCDSVFIWDLPSLNADKKSLIVTKVFEPDINFLVKIDLETGKQTLLSNDPVGSTWATLDPAGNRMAFLSGKENSATFHILDWNNHKTEVVWRDAEERLIAISHSLQQNKEYPLAISTYRDLIDKYPNSRFLNLAWFRMMQIYLTPPSVDIDKAFETLNRMPESNQLASSIFWSETDLSATDPREDWIVKYGTNEAYNKFEFNTDLTRDLLGLSVKSSDKRLFLKIDYNSNRDLSGLTFADTVILMDYDTPNEGFRKIGDLSEWERGAERIIVLRHWYPHGTESQYDLSILNGKGEIVTHFLASGFAPPQLPHLEVFEIQGFTDTLFLSIAKNKVTDLLQPVGLATQDSQITIRNTPKNDVGSIVLSISKDMLDLNTPKKMFIQICTLKGGIESFEGKERPITALHDEKPICDVADAFGEENTEKRILTEFQPGKPSVIRGYAVGID